MRYHSALLIIILFLIASPIFAKDRNWRLRTFIGLEPISQISVGASGLDPGTIYTSQYGATAGVEASWILGQIIETGIGLNFQFPRGIQNATVSEATFHFIPIYALFRINFHQLELFTLFLQAKVGYAFFIAGDGFGRAVSESLSRPMTSYTGAFHVAGNIGVYVDVLDRPAFNFLLTIDVGYGFYSGSGNNGDATHVLNYMAMSVAFGVDMRF